MTEYRTIKLQGYTILVAVDEPPTIETYPRLRSLVQPEHDLVGCSWTTCAPGTQPGSLTDHVRLALAPTPGKTIDMRRFSGSHWPRYDGPWPGGTVLLVSPYDWQMACVYEAPQWLKDRMTNAIANSGQTSVADAVAQMKASAAQREVALALEPAPLSSEPAWKPVHYHVLHQEAGKKMFGIRGTIPVGFDEHIDEIIEALAFWRKYRDFLGETPAGALERNVDHGVDMSISTSYGTSTAAGSSIEFKLGDKSAAE